MFSIMILLMAIVLSTNILAANAIICWQCSASNEKDCKKNGYFEECLVPHSEFVCYTKVTRNHAHFQIVKGCKQDTACIDERKQNWGRLGQCKDGLQSTCRCCCFKDFCNEDSCVQEKKETCRALPLLLNNGSVRCTDSNNVGSTCRFRCPRRNDGKNITLIPNYSNTITCLPNGKWSSPIPNCRESCGPNIRVDLIVLTHRPTEAETLSLISRVSRPFLNSVHVGPNNLLLSRMHYRTHVHHPHLTFRDNIIKNKSEIIEFLENQPFELDDTGPVKTGEALWYIYNNIINKEGDRPDATNILGVDSTELADDDVIAPARALRKAGVVFIPRVIPESKTNYQKAKEEMNALAGYRSNWFLESTSLEWELRGIKTQCRFSFPILV